MRNINQTLLDKLASEEYRPAMLLKIEADPETVYYTTWDYGIAHSGEVYLPRGFHFNTIKYGASSVVDNMTIKIDDVDREIYALLYESSIQTPPATLTLVVLDADGEELAATDLFIGTISEWSYEPGTITFKISSVFVQWANVTTSTFSGSCRWKVFKGDECKYVGTEEVCDRTYKACESFSNTDNFGGFRWIQSLEDKISKPSNTRNLIGFHRGAI